MGIQVRIGNDMRDLGAADPAWVNRSIDGRRDDGVGHCVQVLIDEPHVKLSLRTANCSGSGGGGRRLTDEEQTVVELWHKHELHQMPLVSGRFVAFLKQLKRIT